MFPKESFRFNIIFLRVLPSKFKSINQRLSAVKVGNFEICQNPLRLGQLQGNRFEIFIR